MRKKHHLLVVWEYNSTPLQHIINLQKSIYDFCPHRKKVIYIHLLYIVIRNVTYSMYFFVSMDIIWQIDIKNPLLYISNAPFSVSLQTKRTFWKTYIEITMFVTKWSVCLIFSCDWDFAVWGRDASELRSVRNRDIETW